MKPCKICSLPPRTRKAVDRAIVEGASAAKVAERFKGKISTSGVRRHKIEGHVPVYSTAALAEAQGQVLMDRRGLDHLKDIIDRQWDMFRAADKAGQIANANTSLRDLGTSIERLMDVSGEAAQAKMMSLKDVTIDEKLVTAFLEATVQRPHHIVAHLGKEIARLTGPRVIQINFVKPPAFEERPAELIEQMAGSK